MTATMAIAHFVFAASSSSKSSSGSSSFFLIAILAVGVLGYFFFLRPQQKKAQAARAAQGSGIEVGDEVQTVGGVIGTVLEIHGDRYTLLTGALGQDGNLDGPQPTRIVFVRQAIARKIEPISDVQVKDEPVESEPVENSTNGKRTPSDGSDIDDVGGDSTHGEHREEAEEG
jgi:preprotein translocase YajC subunit